MFQRCLKSLIPSLNLAWLSQAFALGMLLSMHLFLPDAPCLEVELPFVRFWPIEVFFELDESRPAIVPPGVYP